MKINNKDTKMRMRKSFWCLMVNFDQISHIVPVFALLFEQVNASWVITWSYNTKQE